MYYLTYWNPSMAAWQSCPILFSSREDADNYILTRLHPEMEQPMISLITRSEIEHLLSNAHKSFNSVVDRHKYYADQVANNAMEIAIMSQYLKEIK